MSVDVLTILQGGLGNQLFELAATYTALDAVGGSRFELIRARAHSGGPTLRDVVDVAVREPNRRDRAMWVQLASAPGPLREVFQRSARIHQSATKRRVIRPPHPFLGPVTIHAGDRLVLDGWFQHPFWFGGSWMRVADALIATAPEVFQRLVEQRRTVVHLRRGDYVPNQWELQPAYYKRALAALSPATGEVVVICDEPHFIPWFVEMAASLGLRVIPPEPLGLHPALGDFWNAAAAAQLVVANSTFSWWAAAVATCRGDGASVRYPQPWMANGWTPEPLVDLGLPEWTAVESGFVPFFEPDQRRKA